MNSKRVAANLAMAVLQMVVVSLLTLALYRFLLDAIGVTGLGVWSLVLSSAAVGRVANLGMSGGVVKYVAKYATYNATDRVIQVLQTTLASTAFLTGALLLGFSLVADPLLALVLEGSALDQARSVLPLAIASVWLSGIASIVEGGLDGYQRIDLRAAMRIAVFVCYVLLALALANRMGLIGLGLAHVAQQLAVICIALVLLRRKMGIAIVPFRWDPRTFRELLAYGASLQMINIVVLIGNPLLKGLLSRYGGVDFLGMYEVATQVVYRIRDLILTAVQALVPTLASIHERTPREVARVYRSVVELLMFIATPVYAATVAGAPALSTLLLQTHDSAFTTAVALIAIALYVNTIASPAYTAFLAVGRLRWNTVGMVIQPVLLAPVSMLIGEVVGGMGILAVWAALAIAGSLISLVGFHREYRLGYRLILNLEHMPMLVVCLAALIAALIATNGGAHSGGPSYLVITVVCTLFVVSVTWFHPARRKLQRFLVPFIRNVCRRAGA